MRNQIPHSAISTIRWPPVVSGLGAQLLAQHYQFRRTERWDPARMRARQFAQLSHLVTHAERTMPFWRARLREAGIDPGAPLTEESWARIPILSREDVRNAGTALHCLSVPAAHGAVQRGSTSGSSGTPLGTLQTDVHQLFWSAGLLRELLWAGFDFRGKIAIIRRGAFAEVDTGDGRSFPSWGEEVEALYPTGPALVFDVRRPLREQADWLSRIDPDYFLTVPSVLGALARHFRDTGKKLRKLRGIRTFGEVVGKDLRDLCQDVFGASIADCYSCEEAGYLAVQCPSHQHLHVIAELVKLEILDDAGRPCGPGETGRVIVTPLHNFAMPLLRYEVGDLAEFGPPCDCGRCLPVLRRVIGRMRNLLTLPSGERRVAYLTDHGFYKIDALRQFQVAQTSVGAIEIRLVVRHALSPETEAGIVETVHTMLGHRFDARVVYLDEIPHGPTGKVADFVPLPDDMAASGPSP